MRLSDAGFSFEIESSAALGFGSVPIPQEAFIAALRMGGES